VHPVGVVDHRSRGWRPQEANGPAAAPGRAPV
jgi:hypothetical protein